jgi:TatA/E family protein of Tat protein translocase
MGIENPVHLIFLAAVALLVLGPKRLPEVARSLGKGIREFREAMNDGSVGGFMHDHHDGVGGGATSTPVPPAPAQRAQVHQAPVQPVEHGVADVPSPAPMPAPVPPAGEEIQDADVVSAPAPGATSQ